jgi:hypothetical protein
MGCHVCPVEVAAYLGALSGLRVVLAWATAHVARHQRRV